MSKENVCVYAGSFDPPTQGHMYMIRRGSQLFPKLIVAVGSNPNKHYTFSTEERVEMLRACTKSPSPQSEGWSFGGGAPFANVEIDHFEGLFLVDYAESIGVNYILRGIRSQEDYEFERAMRNVNEDLKPNIATVFLIPPREMCEVSSSFVKGLVGPEGWEDVIKPYVPPPIYEKLLQANVRWHTQSAGPQEASD